MDRKQEYDVSYDGTTCHASITCKCGIKVWYGCGANDTTRPIFCRDCTKKELDKLKRNTQFEMSDRPITGKSDAQIIMFYLRRAIPEDTRGKESVN
jgi:hypothetical protein